MACRNGIESHARQAAPPAWRNPRVIMSLAADNTLARLVQMVEEAQASKGRSQRFIERFGRRYSPAVLAIGTLLALIPGLLGMGWEEWLTRATVFIVAAAPCALVISIPITYPGRSDRHRGPERHSGQGRVKHRIIIYM